jgi:diacylglycerol kinase family enzyme
LQSLPLFNSSSPFQIVLTERANHARDLLLSLPLAHLDGVISVGGDGMFAEVKKAIALFFFF